MLSRHTNLEIGRAGSILLSFYLNLPPSVVLRWIQVLLLLHIICHVCPLFVIAGLAGRSDSVLAYVWLAQFLNVILLPDSIKIWMLECIVGC